MGDLILSPLNAAYTYVFGDESTERELSEVFSYELPGAKFLKRGWRKNWNGRIYLISRTTNLVPTGLVPRIITWAEENGHKVDNRLQTVDSCWDDFEYQKLIDQYPPPEKIEIRDYQRRAINWAMTKRRCALISPTGSGKSLVLYYLVRARMSEGPILLVVPTISLVSQMASDWESYGWHDVGKSVHEITGGVPKITKKPVVISTWQSIFREDPEWFSRFTTLLIDECHLAKAASIKGIGDKMPECDFRIGVTGTLDDTKSHRLVVEGVLGKGYRVAKTTDLQTGGFLSPIRVQAHHLHYSSHERWMVAEHHRTYQSEIDFVVQHPGRLSWLVQFIGQLPGNVLVLFQFIEKHGEPLHHGLVAAYGNTRPIHYVVGSVSGDDREDIRHIVEEQDNAIIAASVGTFSTGIDMKKIHHVVLASPSKSKYRVLQSIGRGLRLHASKKTLYVMDLVDRLDSKEYRNYAYKHWKVRSKFYEDESFAVEQYEHQLQ